MTKQYRTRVGLDYRAPRSRSGRWRRAGVVIARVVLIGALLGALTFAALWLWATIEGADSSKGGLVDAGTSPAFLAIGWIVALLLEFTDFYRPQPAVQDNVDAPAIPKEPSPAEKRKSRLPWWQFVLILLVMLIAGTVFGQIGRELVEKLSR